MKEVRRKYARTAAPPLFVEPQLAQLKKSIPRGENWLYELKYDGYRTFCRMENGRVSLLTRNGHDWTTTYGTLASDLEELPVKNALLDGEIIWPDAHGRPDFQGLQNAISIEAEEGFIYCVFDLLFLEGEDLREKPLIERKKILKDLLTRSGIPSVQYSEHFEEIGDELLQQSCQLDLEGIVSKDANAPYISGRGPAWQKIKCGFRQEFVIGGYLRSDSSSRGLRSLLLGFYKHGKLHYAGKVGTGFNAISENEVLKKLARVHSSASPFDVSSPRSARIQWVKPKLVAEIEFRSWTGDGKIRHGSFQGLRKDKPASNVRKEA